MKLPSVSVIGGGSWATALSKLLLNNCSQISWFIRNESDIASFKQNGHNPKYLTSVNFNTEKICFRNSLKECIDDSKFIILAVPSAFLHQALHGIEAKDLKGKVFFSAVKGIIPEYHLIVGEYLHNVFSVDYQSIGVITGPCHAEEVAMEKLSYLTIASQNTDAATSMSEMLNCKYLRSTVSDDIYGTEYAAVLKNVVAVAGGMCHGLGYGDNFLAVLVSNAIQEIERFVSVVHPINRDIKASAYLGDLLVTAYSQFSRNRTFGNMIGKGYSVKNAQLEMNMIAEGYYAAKCVHEMNQKLRVHMPITNAVYNVVYEHADAGKEMQKLSEQLS